MVHDVKKFFFLHYSGSSCSHILARNAVKIEGFVSIFFLISRTRTLKKTSNFFKVSESKQI